MEKAHAINPERIVWCCKEQRLSVEQLAEELGIAQETLKRAVEGESTLSINQLRKIAVYFNRGLLFFLETGPVNEKKVHTAQFRSIRNQKPTLTPKLKALVERVECQRQVYISLLEDLGDGTGINWYPDNLALDIASIKQVAASVRKWLGLAEGSDFWQMRHKVEAKGIMIFVSNGYQGQWQIAKENPIRGFSLYYDQFPVIVVKKQASEGPQAFTLMHELAHLLLHRESFIDDEEDFNSYRGKEKAANEFAGNLLVPDSLLAQIDISNFPFSNVRAYDNFLKSHAKRWCVSSEVILRRLLIEGNLPKGRYQAYRQWKKSLPLPEGRGGGIRYRFKEPVRLFGEPYVHTVLDALHSQQITLAKACTYLDNLKIKDLRRLEDARVRI